MPLIDSARIHDMFMDTIIPTEDLMPVATLVQGIHLRCPLLNTKLEEYKAEILSALLNLPDDFMKSKGQGASFLGACYDKNGEQWGEHSTMNELFMLEQGIGRVTLPLPQDMWSALPGGLPYYTVDDLGE